MWLMMNWWWRLVMTNPTNDQLDAAIALALYRATGGNDD
jgi:hypothetical protein